jgi:hypothetical protein
MTPLVVAGNRNVNELSGGVGVAESNDGDVDVAGLFDGLSIGTRVGDDDETRLLEGSSDVVGEVTRGETTSNGDSPGMSSEFEDSALPIWTSRDNTDVSGVVDGGDDSSSKDDFLP